MSLAKPGDFITAKCSRCNDLTGHVVMLVLDGAIAKVECKACGSVHKYRSPDKKRVSVSSQSSVRHVRVGQSREEGRTVASETRTTTVPASAGTGRAAPRRSAAAKMETAWQEAMAERQGESPLPYSMHSTYAPQDYLEHPVFGLGLILEIIRPDKMTVLFREGKKILRCKVSG